MLEFTEIPQEKSKELTFQQRVFLHKQCLTDSVKKTCGERQDLVKDVVWALIALRNERVGYDAHEFRTTFPGNRDVYLFAKQALDAINPADLDAGINDPLLIPYVRSQLEGILSSNIFNETNTVESFTRTIRVE